MKQAAVGGGIAVVVLCAVGLGYLLMSGPTSNDPPAPTASADGHEAAAPATTTPDPEDDRGSAPPPTAHMPQARVERRLQVNKAERPQLDPDDPRVGLKDPEKWKEHRKQRNRQWRDDQLAIASSWVSSSSLSPEQGQEVLDILVEESGVDVDVEQNPALLRPSDEPLLLGDNSRLRALGWERRHTFRETLQTVYADWLARTPN